MCSKTGPGQLKPKKSNLEESDCEDGLEIPKTNLFDIYIDTYLLSV